MSYDTAFDGRQDLQKYGSNALLLYALELRFQIEDIDTVAADALTDGSDDKKCDLVYVDTDDGNAVIAQGYFSSTSHKTEAPSNKAADLNTAAGWLLNRDISDLPERLRPAATQLRSAINEGQIRTIQFWYVHNLPESQNVRNELKTVQSTAYAALKALLPANTTLSEVSALEIGRETLSEWYQSLTNPILVSDSFEINIPGGYQLYAADCSAFVTAVPAKWLYNIFIQYKSQLFSANIRGYLGSRDADANINNGIKETARNDPEHSWPFNNGLTILVNNFEHIPDKNCLSVSGLSIVNGAQTTGAIGSLGQEPGDSAMVPARFVSCSNAATVMSIIKFNNSQNKVEAPDFRSNDVVQKRLRTEFAQIGAVTYFGGRRGGHEDRIRRPPNLLPSDTAGQALAAFHGETVVAYNEKSRLWISDSLYSRYFSEKTKAIHIIFVVSLLRAIESRKRALLDGSAQGTLTEIEKAQLAFLRNRGATFLLTTAIASCLETIVGKSIPDRFQLSFGSQVTLQGAEALWEPVVNACIPFADQLSRAVTNGLKSNELVNQTVHTFRSLVEATKGPNQPIYADFSSKVAFE